MRRASDAQAVARTIDGMPADKIPPLFLAKGNYFSLSVRSPFSRLVYPMPAPGGLGVHLTLDLAGQARFGPDVEWVETIDYDVDPRRAESFYAAIRTYWPDLPDGALQPAYAGIRPKIARPGGSSTDFLIQTERDHGVRGLVNLFGIESPGLTASLAIAEEIAEAALRAVPSDYWTCARTSSDEAARPSAENRKAFSWCAAAPLCLRPPQPLRRVLFVSERGKARDFQ